MKNYRHEAVGKYHLFIFPRSGMVRIFKGVKLVKSMIVEGLLGNEDLVVGKLTKKLLKKGAVA